MSDHAAIGTTDDSSPKPKAVTSSGTRGEYKLAKRRGAGKRAEPKDPKRCQSAHATQDTDHDRGDSCPGGKDKAPSKLFTACLAPGKRWRNRHEKQQRNTDRDGEGVEV